MTHRHRWMSLLLAVLAFTSATLISSSAANATSGREGERPSGTSSITGVVTKDATTPGYPHVTAIPVGPTTLFGVTAEPGPDGSYTIPDLPAGEYRLEATDDGRGDTYDEWWPDATSRSMAQTITLGDNEQARADFQVHVGVRLAGATSIKLANGDFAITTTVHVYRRDPSGVIQALADTTTDSDGQWTYPQLLAPATYLIGYDSGDLDYYGLGPETVTPPQFHGGMDEKHATAISAPLGVTDIYDQLSAAHFSSQRVAGPDRFQTAAAVSQSVVPDGGHASIVYVANGQNFPDALSGGPAAADDHSVLLTTMQSSLPAATAAELHRLQPTEVRILGGTASISDSVAVAIASASGARVTRTAGADRYETSDELALAAFPHGTTTTAFIATGRDFPDTLAASGAAAHLGAPVILVDGLASHLDESTRTVLQTLGVSRIYILGGSTVLTTGIEDDLEGLLPGSVTRLGGADRWTTSALVGALLPHSSETIVVNGTGFADAVVAAPLAAALSAPIELSQTTCIPESVESTIIGAGGTHLTLVGGTAVLTGDVANGDGCTGPYITGSP
jgi:putative cell wall-binding protein